MKRRSVGIFSDGLSFESCNDIAQTQGQTYFKLVTVENDKSIRREEQAEEGKRHEKILIRGRDRQKVQQLEGKTKMNGIKK